MIYTITAVKVTEDAAWQGLHRTWFTANGSQMYILHQPGNAPKVGDELDGSTAPDKRGQLKFTKTKTFTQNPQLGSTASSRPSAPQERIFKADPDKQASIEWQASVKAAVEAVRDFYALVQAKPSAPATVTLEEYKRDIVNTAITFAAVVDKQPEHTIEQPATEAPADPPADEPELPPVESYTEPGDIDLNDIPF